MTLALSVRIESWPLAGAFTIARGTRFETTVVVAELSDGSHIGCGEGVPLARYRESTDSVAAALATVRGALTRGLDRSTLQQVMPAGAAATHSTARSGTWRRSASASPCMHSPGLPRHARSPPPIRFPLARRPRWRMRRHVPAIGCC